MSDHKNADHPGRFCEKCGKRVYPFWIDRDNPPPGTCPEAAPQAAWCSTVMESLCLGYWIAKEAGEALHPDYVALMERTGVTEAEVAHWQAARDFEQSFGSIAAPGPHRDLARAIDDFIHPEGESETVGQAPRALTLIRHIADQVDFADGQLSWIDLQEVNEEFVRRATMALEGSLYGRDYEPGED